MANDDGPGEALSPSEQRVVELLGLLGTEVVTTRTDLPSSVVRRLRGQRDSRVALTVASGLLAAVAAGLVALLPRAGAEDVRG
jgi:hypothetical protein